MRELITRPYRDGDAAALAALMVDLGTAAGAEPDLTAGAVRAWFRSGLVRDAAADTRLVTDDGRLAAAALLASPADGGCLVDAFGGVLPAWRGLGLGRRLLAWQLERGRELRAALAPDARWELDADAYRNDEPALRLFERFGFGPVRYWYEMAVVLDQPATTVGDPEKAGVPAGLRVVPFSDGMAVALHAAETEAMAGHFGYEPRGFDSWAELALQDDAFRPDLTRLALDGDEVAGYVRVADERGDRVRISAVGTRARWRGRGLASALLRQALAGAAADGRHRATLGVDSQNPTGAVGIYQRTGFEVVSSWVSYRKPLS